MRLVGDRLLIVRAGRESVLSLAPTLAPKRPEVVSFRRDRAYAVWDARGLSIRQGGRIVTNRLEAEGRGPATSLAGSARVKGKAYFLVRWDGPRPAERLYRVDLLAPRPTIDEMGDLGGVTLADTPIDTKLFIWHGKLAAGVRRADGDWGLATFEPGTKRFDYRPYGTGLVSLAPGGVFVERYGSGFRAGIVSFARRERRTLMESKEEPELVDDAAPALLRADGKLRNAFTGAVVTLPESSRVVRRGALVAIVPPGGPRWARLVDMDRGVSLADARR